MNDSSTVLLAEDNEDDVLLTQIAFKKARLANPLQIVRDGTQVLSYLKGEGQYADRLRYAFPMLLLLDLRMPKINGFEVLSWLQTKSGLKHLPVAVMTSSADEPDIERAYELGANSYLIKPPNAEALLGLVQRLKAYWLIIKDNDQNQPRSISLGEIS
jgi:CheY-like chemotaxis protein